MTFTDAQLNAITAAARAVMPSYQGAKWGDNPQDPSTWELLHDGTATPEQIAAAVAAIAEIV